MKNKVEIRHFHLFCGLGGGAAGFNQGEARVGSLEAEFRCIGGVDVDPRAIQDFSHLAGVPGTVLDMFSREQYTAFHGKEPPQEWREVSTIDIQRAAGNENPHIVFLSAPCKGFSGLLSQAKSGTDKYQALNELTVRGMWLALEAFADEPPEFFIFENVPRIASRGRHLLDQINGLLQSYGYAVAETTHDCGEIGGLAQSRRRFLLVARHIEKVPAFLYEPTKRPLRSVGEILNKMPMPGHDAAGPMHRVPRLHWKTWVRLAFVEAGSDWRSLNKLAVTDGYLRDYAITSECHAGFLGVNNWDSAMGTVAGRTGPTNGKFSVADPRSEKAFGGKYRVTAFDSAAGTVISSSTTGQGAFAVADPRSSLNRTQGDHYLHGGHYGVVPWDSQSYAVAGAAKYDNGRWSVADPRIPQDADQVVAIIQALDGTWHRPFTTLELAALQGLVEPEEHLELAGLSDSDWRERIGNAVPKPAAKAIGSVLGETLLLAWSGETFVLSSTPVWVRPVAIAITLSREENQWRI